MKFLDGIILLVLFFLLFLSMYFLWLNLPIGSEQFQNYSIQTQNNLPEKSTQFYQNTRYPDRVISYEISQNCSNKRKNDFKKAASLLEEKTILSFVEVEKGGQILVSCSNIAPRLEEKDHFIAGEGGPSRIINATRYSVVLSGKIALYRPETCDEPKIALHELLHALGFDHNNDAKSIMYPITSCNQQIDQYIIEEINRLYSIPSRPDLVLDFVSANKSGRYLNFEAIISNSGFKDSSSFKLQVIADGSLVKEFEVEAIPIGIRRHLTITNLLIPRKTEKLSLKIETTEPEISKDNNSGELVLIENKK